MLDDDIKELKELLFFNLKLNTIILSGLAASKEFSGPRREVGELLKKAKAKLEKLKKDK